MVTTEEQTKIKMVGSSANRCRKVGDTKAERADESRGEWNRLVGTGSL